MFVEIENEKILRAVIQKELFERFIETYFEYRETDRRRKKEEYHVEQLSLAA